MQGSTFHGFYLCFVFCTVAFNDFFICCDGIHCHAFFSGQLQQIVLIQPMIPMVKFSKLLNHVIIINGDNIIFVVLFPHIVTNSVLTLRIMVYNISRLMLLINIKKLLRMYSSIFHLRFQLEEVMMVVPIFL